jgi:hypothetical protein
MSERPLRVLHCPVNMAGTGWANVRALRRKGVDATLLVTRPQRWRPDEYDVAIGRPQTLLGRQLVQWRAFLRFLPRTDVFHFYFGETLVPRIVQFRLLRAAGRKGVYHFLGSDIRRKTPEELAWAQDADARIVGSYDAIRWVPDATVVPQPLELAQYEPPPTPERERPVVLHAPSNRRNKGTDVVVAACDGLPVELRVIEGVPHDEAVKLYADADVVVDQLNAGWYGVFAIEAMALGKPVLCFLHDEAVRRSEEAFGTQVPIVRVTKETLRERLRALVASPEERRRIGAAGRAYVELVHDSDRIADRLLELYRRL